MRALGRPVAAALLLAALSPLPACRATLIGTPCARDRDCNVAGQRCVAAAGGPRVCTRACRAQTGAQGCPIGFDCGPADATRPDDLTCNPEHFAYDPQTGTPLLLGKSCALATGTTQAEWNVGCAATGDPAPAPVCRHAPDPTSSRHPPAPLFDDPHAYCTAACQSDVDCPVDQRCAADYDGSVRCLRRGFCDPCVIDEDCGGELDACVPTADGRSRYCSKRCAAAADCAGAHGTYLACTPSTNAAGVAGSYCLHKFGACVGSGALCDPCRSDGDCAAGTFCALNATTGERMCTKACTSDGECASDKPTGCDVGPPPTHPYDPIYTDLCTGDALHRAPGLLTCFL